MEMLKTALEANKKLSENFEELNTRKKYGLKDSVSSFNSENFMLDKDSKFGNSQESGYVPKTVREQQRQALDDRKKEINEVMHDPRLMEGTKEEIDG